MLRTTKYLIVAANVAFAALCAVLATAAVAVTAASGAVGQALPRHATSAMLLALFGFMAAALLFLRTAYLTLRDRWVLAWQLAPIVEAAVIVGMLVVLRRS